MSPVYINTDCASLAAALKECGAGRVFIVCDAAVRGFVGSQVVPQTGSVPVFEIAAGEKTKSLSSVESICRWLLENGADRKSFLLAVGGGITSDMAGFAASIYMRGISFAYVPTTLLAMVDAAIGGKTGVNFLDYKNMLGTFCQPRFTYVATSALSTLPMRDVLGGASEMLKSFIIENRSGNYESAVRLLSSLKRGEQAFSDTVFQTDLTVLVGAAAAVKTGIVERDFREGGERRKLNLGHTFAHAIEHLARERGGDVSHGEAVSMGMVLAARLSEAKGIAPKGLAQSLKDDMEACGLAVGCPYAVSDMAEAMCRDKKSDGALVNFVLIRAVGDVVIEPMTPADAVSLLA